MAGPELLPAGVRLLHIGPPKTGTTAIQVAMSRVRDEMAEQGVHYAGEGSRPRRAGKALIPPDNPDRIRPEMEHWDRLVEEVAAAGEVRVCISNERFAAADDATARRVVEGLGGDRVHVVATVRRLDKLLASQWQERIKWRSDAPAYDDWLSIVLGPDRDGDHWEHFWDAQDLEALITRWVGVTSPDRVTIIVADESNRDLLPRTFERLLGLTEGLIRPVSLKSNQSLSMNEATFLQGVDRAARDYSWPDWLYDDQVKRAISRAVRRHPRGVSDAGIATPAWAIDRIQELNRRRREVVEASGVRINGDLDRLTWDADDARVQSSEEQVRATQLVESGLAAKAVTAAIECTLQARPGVVGHRTGTSEPPAAQANVRLRRQVGRLRRKNKRLQAQLQGREVQGKAGQSTTPPERGLARRVGTRLMRRLRSRSGS